MPDQQDVAVEEAAVDDIVFPDAWLEVLHPRRGGRAAWQYQVSDADHEQLTAVRDHHRDDTVEVLTHPASDPRLVALVRDDAVTVETVAARLAVASALYWSASPVVLADGAVRALGLLDALDACLQSLAACVLAVDPEDADPDRWYPRRQALLVRATVADVPGVRAETQNEWVLGPAPAHDLLEHLRRLLAIADDATYRSAVERVAVYRHGNEKQRRSASYLLPDRRDWVDEDAANGGVSAYVAYLPGQLRRFGDLAEIVTAIDVMGAAVVPAVARSLDDVFMWSEDARQVLLGVLSTLPADEAVRHLLERVDLGSDVAAVLTTAIAADERRAVRVLDAHPEAAGSAVLAARLRGRGPAADLAVAPDDALPASLARPPWTRPTPEPLTVMAPDPSPRIEWRDGEREDWAHWGPYEEDARYSDPADAPDFYLFGIADVVRPRLAEWQAEKSWFYLRSPRLLVHRFELDAYAPVLRLARGKPVVGAPLLLPFVSRDVALLMAGWLVRSRQFGPTAREWFDRHGAAAAAHLIEPAASAVSPEAAVAARALARLDPDVVRRAGRDLGAEDVVAALLDRDPLDLAPGRAVRLPRWLDPSELPPVRTRSRRHLLGDDHRVTLLRLLAQSRVDDPHPALADACEGLDGEDAAAFAWALYGAWLLAGKPAKDAWAFDALGALGDDAVALRLAPRVRLWPSMGGAQRAKRGVEVLGAIDSTAALQQVSAIGRTARSTPLRTHAGVVLDRVASDRGLLPEQLEDLVAPDAGLGATVTVGGADFTVALDDAGTVVLLAGDGTPVTTLPTPSDDDGRAAVASWRRTKRDAGKVVREQSSRLEQAMVTQRVWARGEFEAVVLAHPLLGRLARGLVWTVDEQPAVIDPLGDLVDEAGRLVLGTGWVRIAHPATSELEPFRARLEKHCPAPPFEQLGRPVFRGDPTRYWNAVVSAASLHALVRLGWRWGSTGSAALRHRLVRPLSSDRSVLLGVDPGVSAVGDTAAEPEQRIVELRLHSAQHDLLGLFADLPRPTRSELLRELSVLDLRDESG